jgi:hypothetical protein
VLFLDAVVLCAVGAGSGRVFEEGEEALVDGVGVFAGAGGDGGGEVADGVAAPSKCGFEVDGGVQEIGGWGFGAGVGDAFTESRAAGGGERGVGVGGGFYFVEEPLIVLVRVGGCAGVGVAVLPA